MFRRPSTRAPSIRLRRSDLLPLAFWLKGSSRPKSKLAISAGSGTIASLGGVLVRDGSAFARRAASLALAICSRNALEEFPAFGGDSFGAAPTSDFRDALAFAIRSREAADEVETLRVVIGVVLAGGLRAAEGVTSSTIAVPGGDIAWPKTPLSEARDFGVRAVMLLLVPSGRGFGVF